jgi:hypothetical protein
VLGTGVYGEEKECTGPLLAFSHRVDTVADQLLRFVAGHGRFPRYSARAEQELFLEANRLRGSAEFLDTIQKAEPELRGKTLRLLGVPHQLVRPQG